ncbi:MAG: zinc ribbon domain-containing protein, partial [Candidatus Hodarchaeota archaeon]
QSEKYVDREDELARVLHWWDTVKKPTPPCRQTGYQPRKLPRRATVGTTMWLHTNVSSQLTGYWLEMYYPRNPSSKGKKTPRVWLPLSLSSYHRQILTTGQLKTVELVKQLEIKRWYVHMTIEIPPPKVNTGDKPLAIFSIDLGAKKDATAVLLASDTLPATPGERPRLTKEAIWFFTQPEKKQRLNELDNQIAELQRQRDYWKVWSEGQAFQARQQLLKNIHRKLKRLRHQRHRLAVQYDHRLVNQILAVVRQLEQTYTIYLVLGRLKGIYHRWHKGRGTSRRVRRELHRWAYARLSSFLLYELPRIGLPATRLLQVSEAWTSQTCHRCGSRQTRRPFQSLLICEACGAHHQADVNGAINLALRLITSLLQTTALDQWLSKSLMDQKQKAISALKNQRQRSGSEEHPITSSNQALVNPSVDQ